MAPVSNNTNSQFGEEIKPLDENSSQLSLKTVTSLHRNTTHFKDVYGPFPDEPLVDFADRMLYLFGISESDVYETFNLCPITYGRNQSSCIPTPVETPQINNYNLMLMRKEPKRKSKIKLKNLTELQNIDYDVAATSDTIYETTRDTLNQDSLIDTRMLEGNSSTIKPIEFASVSEINLPVKSVSFKDNIEEIPHISAHEEKKVEKIKPNAKKYRNKGGNHEQSAANMPKIEKSYERSNNFSVEDKMSRSKPLSNEIKSDAILSQNKSRGKEVLQKVDKSQPSVSREMKSDAVLNRSKSSNKEELSQKADKSQPSLSREIKSDALSRSKSSRNEQIDKSQPSLSREIKSDALSRSKSSKNEQVDKSQPSLSREIKSDALSRSKSSKNEQVDKSQPSLSSEMKNNKYFSRIKSSIKELFCKSLPSQSHELKSGALIESKNSKEELSRTIKDSSKKLLTTGELTEKELMKCEKQSEIEVSKEHNNSFSLYGRGKPDAVEIRKKAAPKDARKISATRWALTKVNVFNDDSRTYEIMDVKNDIPKGFIPGKPSYFFTLSPNGASACFKCVNEKGKNFSQPKNRETKKDHRNVILFCTKK